MRNDAYKQTLLKLLIEMYQRGDFDESTDDDESSDEPARPDTPILTHATIVPIGG